MLKTKKYTEEKRVKSMKKNQKSDNKKRDFFSKVSFLASL